MEGKRWAGSRGGEEEFSFIITNISLWLSKILKVKPVLKVIKVNSYIM